MKPVILCVDDERVVLESLKNEVKLAIRGRLHLEVAESAEDALEIIDDFTKKEIEIPIIISDYLMPQMKGDEFIIKVHQILPDTKKILLTGHATTEGVGNIINNAELFNYIQKPWEKENLYLVIKEAFKSYYNTKELKLYHFQLEEKVKLRTKELEESKDKIQILLNKSINGIVISFIKLLSNAHPDILDKSIRLKKLAKLMASSFFPKESWEIETAALFSHLGCLNMKPYLFQKYLRGDILNTQDINDLRNYIISSSEILEGIPHFNKIKSSITNIYYPFSDLLSDEKLKISNTSKVLRLIIDFDYHKSRGKTNEEVFNILEENKKYYDLSVLNGLRFIILGKQIVNDSNIKPYSISQLLVGMKIYQNVIDEEGNIILYKHDELDSLKILELAKISKKRKIIEPIFVYN